MTRAHDCECEVQGYCPRYGCVVHKSTWQLCQGDAKYRAFFMDNNPCHETTRLAGDVLSDTLRKMGITEESYKEVKQRFGLPPTCNCAARREWLNKVHQWAKDKLLCHL